MQVVCVVGRWGGSSRDRCGGRKKEQGEETGGGGTEQCVQGMGKINVQVVVVGGTASNVARKAGRPTKLGEQGGVCTGLW